MFLLNLCGNYFDSGYGRFDGRAVIDEFTELKWITIEATDPKSGTAEFKATAVRVEKVLQQ